MKFIIEQIMYFVVGGLVLAFIAVVFDGIAPNAGIITVMCVGYFAMNVSINCAEGFIKWWKND